MLTILLSVLLLTVLLLTIWWLLVLWLVLWMLLINWWLLILWLLKLLLLTAWWLLYLLLKTRVWSWSNWNNTRLNKRLLRLAADFTCLEAWLRLGWLLNAKVNNISWWFNNGNSFDNIWCWCWKTTRDLSNSSWALSRDSDYLATEHWTLVFAEWGYDLINLLNEIWIVDVKVVSCLGKL